MYYILGLVDALADPRAYLSEQKKRQEALLAHMGVEVSDIAAEVPSKSQQNAQKSKPLPRQNGSSTDLILLVCSANIIIFSY